ncbi:hypothetical protein [Streptomyces sp. RTd22]|uniref:hypothetical protein n=1 Tax=Streptomyces sp. RTd22 TaxID=1841249 RepID=UPI0007C53A44|nr:hypothetical protein [Streptomyces sp. RTd22]
MTGLLAVLILLGWLAGIIFLAGVFSSLLANEPLLGLVARLWPVALALYLAVVAVFWPAVVVAKVVDALVNRERP